MAVSLIARLILCAAFTLGLTISEFVLSNTTHSISLLVVANQSFYNLLTLLTGISGIAMVNSDAKTITQKSTFGWHRIETVGALSSLVFLGSLSFGTAIEALQTMFHSGHLDLMHKPLYIFILASVHVLVWLLIMKLIGGYSHYQNLCVKAADQCDQTKIFRPPFLHEIKVANIFRDLASCVILMIVCGCVYTIEENAYPNAIKFVDPCFALLSIFICILTSTKLIKTLAEMLLQGIPTNVPKTEDIKDNILEQCATFIVNVHEVHIWRLDSNQIIGSLHVTYNDFDAYHKAHQIVLDILKSKGINKITIQPEFPNQSEQDPEDGLKTLIQTCYINCREPSKCMSQRCCSYKEKAELDS